MKCRFFSRFIVVLVSFLFVQETSAQLGISAHQSNIPFIGVNYEAGPHFMAEFRISTDTYFDALALEVIGALQLGQNEDVDPYVGLGLRVDQENLGTGIVLPLGLNIYPFDARRFGFHIELAPIVADDIILRGSWGIRYRFL